jgi:hypothetical protein
MGLIVISDGDFLHVYSSRVGLTFGEGFQGLAKSTESGLKTCQKWVGFPLPESYIFFRNWSENSDAKNFSGTLL